MVIMFLLLSIFYLTTKKQEKKRQIQKYKRIQIKKTPKIAQVGDQNKWKS